MIIEILQGLVICVQGGGYVLPGALTVNDGFKDCSFKFVETLALEQVTVENLPLEQITKDIVQGQCGSQQYARGSWFARF